MATLVLVHGGGHGGWCWQPTARILRAGGHDVHTPTLTGFGERSHLGAAAVDFTTFVDDVANVLRFEDLHDVVLVGHSMGGVVVPRVAEVLPERIRRVVWLAAVVTEDGESLIQAVPQSPWIARAVTLGPDGTAHTDPELILDANLQDGTPEQRDFVRQRHLPYPPHALVEPGRLSDFVALGLPTGYIVAEDDRTIEPEVARRFAHRLPDPQRASVPGSHDCMLTRPVEVAAALEAMALAPSVRVVDHPEAGRYEATIDGVAAGIAEYRVAPGRAGATTVTFTHTETLPGFEGNGVGSRLAATALDAVRRRGWRAVPQCPFIAAYIDRHPELSDLVDPQGA